jgi:small-conductance mechanosensitive channel
MPESLRTLLDDALDQLVELGFGLVEAIVLFGLAYSVARLVRRPITRRLSRAALPDNTRVLIERAIPFAIYVVAATLLFSLWGLTWSGLIAAIGVGTIAVGLGLQIVLQSFAGGVVILFERPYAVGDRIAFVGQNIEGRVEDITFRSTVLRTDNGDRVITPNALIFTTSVINRSPERPVRTVVTVTGVQGTKDTVKARAREAIAGISGLPPVEIRLRPAWRPLRLPGMREGGTEDAAAGKATGRLTRASRFQLAWTGPDDEAARQEVIRRLQAAFPDAQIRVRRWQL